MEAERLLDTAIDAFRKIYTEEPGFRGRMVGRHATIEQLATAENLILSLENVLGSRPPKTEVEERYAMATPGRSYWAAVVALTLVFAAILAPSQAQGKSGKGNAPRPEHVIMISIDGMVPDYYLAPQ